MTLARLKEAGVGKLAERQALCNAVAKARRVYAAEAGASVEAGREMGGTELKIGEK